MILLVLLQPLLASGLGTAPVVDIVRGLVVAAFEDLPGRTLTAFHAGASFTRMRGGCRKEGSLIAGIHLSVCCRFVVAILQVISAVAAPPVIRLMVVAVLVPVGALLIDVLLVADLPAH